MNFDVRPFRIIYALCIIRDLSDNIKQCCGYLIKCAEPSYSQLRYARVRSSASHISLWLRLTAKRRRDRFPK